MKSLKNTIIVLLLAVCLLAPAAQAKSPRIMLQEGLYAEQTEGDLEKAVTNFKKATEFSVKLAPIKGVKGEGDTKTGESLERGVSQSIFFAYYRNLSPDKNVEIEAEMQLHYTKMNNFIFQLQNL